MLFFSFIHNIIFLFVILKEFVLNHVKEIKEGLCQLLFGSFVFIGGSSDDDRDSSYNGESSRAGPSSEAVNSNIDNSFEGNPDSEGDSEEEEQEAADSEDEAYESDTEIYPSNHLSEDIKTINAALSGDQDALQESRTNYQTFFGPTSGNSDDQKSLEQLKRELEIEQKSEFAQENKELQENLNKRRREEEDLYSEDESSTKRHKKSNNDDDNNGSNSSEGLGAFIPSHSTGNSHSEENNGNNNSSKIIIVISSIMAGISEFLDKLPF
jgi:hypothetical protein